METRWRSQTNEANWSLEQIVRQLGQRQCGNRALTVSIGWSYDLLPHNLSSDAR